MNTSKWKSVAVAIKDYHLLRGLCKDKFRAPGAMISKILNDYIEFQAQKYKLSVDVLKKKLLNGVGIKNDPDTRGSKKN